MANIRENARRQDEGNIKQEFLLQVQQHLLAQAIIDPLYMTNVKIRLTLKIFARALTYQIKN